MAIVPLMNDVVDFQLVINGINGDERRGCLVIVPSMTLQGAQLMDPEVASKHTNLFPYFKDKVNGVDNPNAYSYFGIQLPNGKLEVIGIPWVNDATYKAITTRICTYVITNFDEKMRGPLAQRLKELGASYTVTERSE